MDVEIKTCGSMQPIENRLKELYVRIFDIIGRVVSCCIWKMNWNLLTLTRLELLSFGVVLNFITVTHSYLILLVLSLVLLFQYSFETCICLYCGIHIIRNNMV